MIERADPLLMDNDAVAQYTLRYTGMDGLPHTEAHAGNHLSLARIIVFLEERGAHCIVAEDENEFTIYENGGFVKQT